MAATANVAARRRDDCHRTANTNALILMENSRKDISPLGGGRGQRKRRRGQGPLISSHVGPPVGSNEKDHSTLTAGNNALSGHLYALNGAHLLGVGDETRVTLANGGAQSTRGRRLRRHRNNHWHWHKPDLNNNGGNRNQHQSTKERTSMDLLHHHHPRKDLNIMSSDSAEMHRRLQSSTQQPHLLQVACLFLPILAGAFWYWTKRRARKVATVLGHDSACATAAAAAATAGRDGTGDLAEGHYRRWYDGPAGGNNNIVNVDDEVDEYCAWYAGHASNGAGSWNPDGSHSLGGGRVNDSFGAANADGTAEGRLEPSTVLWIKGRPREDPRMARDIELARVSSMSLPSATRTAAEESAWQPIQDLYTLDAMQGSGLDLSPSGHDSAYFADPCTDACSIMGSGIAGIHMPRFAPMTMHRGDRLRISCRSATPLPTGASDGNGGGDGDGGDDGGGGTNNIELDEEIGTM